MRAHALALLLVFALVVPATPGKGAQMARATASQTPSASAVVDQAEWSAADLDPAQSAATAMLAQGQQLVHRGEFARAEQFYADTAAQSADLAPRALLLQARTELVDGTTDDAEAVLQHLLDAYPTSDQVAGAYFTLEQVRRAAGDCAGALRALDAFDAAAGPTSIGPYGALQRAQCAAKLGDWPGELAAARAALAIEGGGPRLTQIEALERAAEADLKLGRKQEALDFYNRSLQLAGTRAYRAEMLFTTATIARALGQLDLATDRFRAVVVDYADQARAPGALDALADMNRGATVSPLQAGVVRFNDHDYRAAVSAFDQLDSSSPDWGAAQLKRAEALLKLGQDDRARATLTATVDGDPSSAGSALLRLGQLDERDGDPAAAEANYLRMADAAPDRTAEALFHVGFTRYVRGDVAGALDAWQTGLASGPPAPTLQSQLRYWIAKARPAGSADAQEALTLAAAAAPETYYGLRAQEQLGGTFTIASSPPSSASWLAPGPGELQERAAWFAALNSTPERVAQEVAALPALQRADQLLELGLRNEASWELDGAVQQYADNRDVAHMSAIADWTTLHDLPQLTLRIGKQMRDVVGLGNLPRSLQKQVYPAGWGDLVAEQASAHHVDPLLMLALMRQESSFDPRAQSQAQAMGLTQIVPATARSIASRLGRDDFALRDLFKPATNLEFGTWFMSQLLGDYKGRVFPALAAYDAGGGNVARWLQRFGDDPDVLVEEIPFVETQPYLRIVYDNYWHYQALYGGH
jgi:soluble lytic murein transglycosylase-like protein/tetratricopeptide (TPR) repeat protein